MHVADELVKGIDLAADSWFGNTELLRKVFMISTERSMAIVHI